MGKTVKVVGSVVMGLLVIALIAGLAFASLGQSSVSAAPLAQVATTPSTTVTTSTPITSTTSGVKQSDKKQLRDTFLQSFEAGLGVDSTKLNSAYTSAVNSTVDQAVAAGKLSQAEGDKIKNDAKNGFVGGAFSEKHDKDGAVKKAVKTSAATALGITPKELDQDLKGGQSIAQIAQAKNVDIATVKTAILAGIQSELNTEVSSGKLTQDKATAAYQKASTNIDKLVNHTHSAKTGTHSSKTKTHTHGAKGGHKGASNPTATPTVSQ